MVRSHMPEVQNFVKIIRKQGIDYNFLNKSTRNFPVNKCEVLWQILHDYQKQFDGHCGFYQKVVIMFELFYME